MDADLRDRGVPAQAEILEISGNRVGDYDSAAPTSVSFRLSVHPQGADPLEAEVTQTLPINTVYHLEPGNQVPVVHDPADPAKVAVDVAQESAAAQAQAQDAAAAAQDYMETIKQMTGEDPNRPKTDADVAAAIRSAQQLAQQNAGLIEWAKQAGVPGTPPGPIPGGAGPAPGGKPEGGDSDPIEKLERLAKLRDSGAISDQEFERLKGEILGS
jgi:Short C-terminal domain/Protein of unknown function (DUF3592)